MEGKGSTASVLLTVLPRKGSAAPYPCVCRAAVWGLLPVQPLAFSAWCCSAQCCSSCTFLPSQLLCGCWRISELCQHSAPEGHLDGGSMCHCLLLPCPVLGSAAGGALTGPRGRAPAVTAQLTDPGTGRVLPRGATTPLRAASCCAGGNTSVDCWGASLWSIWRFQAVNTSNPGLWLLLFHSFRPLSSSESLSFTGCFLLLLAGFSSCRSFQLQPVAESWPQPLPHALPLLFFTPLPLPWAP